ncbi:MAG TPA: hypothetical protein VJ417_13530, partial [Candidatus Glassbacteria bacterium]|nr:hypothetical protein [Candidatus Glassbacteria bacterium]
MIKLTICAVGLALLAACAAPAGGPETAEIATVPAASRPGRFPARIWAACDFELLQRDVLWGGRTETANIPLYPANAAAGAARPEGSGRVRLSVSPSDYPRASGNDRVYFRYFLKGASSVAVSLFNIDRQAFHRLLLTSLVQGEWAEAVADFSGTRPEGGGEPIAVGERILDVVFEAGAEKGDSVELIIDDVICFEPPLETTGEAEPFPRRG